jgi:hypothetical protein
MKLLEKKFLFSLKISILSKEVSKLMKTSILRSPKISFPYQIFNLLSIQKMHMVPQGPTLHPPIKVLFVSITKIELQSFSILQNLNILQTGKSLLTLVFSMGMEAWTVLIF